MQAGHIAPPYSRMAVCGRPAAWAHAWRAWRAAQIASSLAALRSLARCGTDAGRRAGLGGNQPALPNPHARTHVMLLTWHMSHGPSSGDSSSGAATYLRTHTHRQGRQGRQRVQRKEPEPWQ